MGTEFFFFFSKEVCWCIHIHSHTECEKIPESTLILFCYYLWAGLANWTEHQASIHLAGELVLIPGQLLLLPRPTFSTFLWILKLLRHRLYRTIAPYYPIVPTGEQAMA